MLQIGKEIFQMENYEDAVGYLVINEDGAVLNSAGELENDETTGNIVNELVNLIDTVDPAVFPQHGCQKISISFGTFSYTICLSNKKVFVMKRKTGDI